MRIALFTIFVFYSVCSVSQTVIKATIKDSRTKETLAYCNVSIKDTYKGTITNADGVFSISVDISKDVLIFSYLGYETKTVKAEKLINNPVVLLVKKDFVIQEAIVHAGDDYLYDLLIKCREKLLKNKKKQVSKVFYRMETNSKTLSVEYPTDKGVTQNIKIIDLNEKPVELLECFYNGYLNGTTIEYLLFKNGRTALAANENYFMTYNTSKAICEINLTNKNDDFPNIPFQFGKMKMKKKFQLEMKSFDDKSYNISFSSLDTSSFSGEVWLEKETFNLLKIHLLIENTYIHPFITIHPTLDTISNVSFNITKTYKTVSDELVPDHVYFNYRFTYNSNREMGLKRNHKNIIRAIDSKGIMYFYDYDKPFILPYFDYCLDVDDYHRMAFIPYNESFWKSNNIIMQTEKQNESFNLLSHNGQLINYREGNYGKDFLASLPNGTGLYGFYFEAFYSFWSPHKGLYPIKKMDQFKTYSKEIISKSIQSDLYNLKAQLLLDITESGDSLICNSYTVFDNPVVYYHLPIKEYTNVFINIFFDICEIERRKMQTKLDSKVHSKEEIDAIYKESLKNMETTTKLYFYEVNLGDNDKMFRKWNQYVFDNLGLDNIKMVEETIKNK